MSEAEPLILEVRSARSRGIGLARRAFRESKGVIDFVGAALLIVLTLPLMVLIGLAIRLTSRGPAIYRQRRVGLAGREFRMWKFRTMIHGAESESGPVWSRIEDPRITLPGRFLRRTHLDELPQLVNVLRGEMSLVGPRPERPIFVKIFSESIRDYDLRHSVRPGITGLAQVLHKYDETVEDVRQKLGYDLMYIRRMCWTLDLNVLIRTVGRVFAGRGR